MIKLMIELRAWLQKQTYGFPKVTLILQFEKREDAYEAHARVCGEASVRLHTKDSAINMISLVGIPIEFHWREAIIPGGKV